MLACCYDIRFFLNSRVTCFEPLVIEYLSKLKPHAVMSLRENAPPREKMIQPSSPKRRRWISTVLCSLGRARSRAERCGNVGGLTCHRSNSTGSFPRVEVSLTTRSSDTETVKLDFASAVFLDPVWGIHTAARKESLPPIISRTSREDRL